MAFHLDILCGNNFAILVAQTYTQSIVLARTGIVAWQGVLLTVGNNRPDFEFGILIVLIEMGDGGHVVDPLTTGHSLQRHVAIDTA